MSDASGHLPPLPPSPLPDALLARCRAAFLTGAVRSSRTTIEVHRTHLRIETRFANRISDYARRMNTDDLVVAIDQIQMLRPVGALSVIVELPRGAAFAVAGPSVRTTLAHIGPSVTVAPRRFRPFFIGFWLIGQRTGPIVDARPLV